MEWSNLGSQLHSALLDLALPTSTGAPLLQLYSAIALLHAKEERRHTAVLSGTCGVQNAVITNSGRPIYVTRQRPGGHLHIP